MTVDAWQIPLLLRVLGRSRHSMYANQINQLLQTAHSAQRSGDRNAAQAAYHAILDADPQNPAALNSLGIMAMDAGAFAEAAGHLRAAIAADGSAPELWLNLAKAQRLGGDDAGEEASLNGALAIDGRHFMANVRKAELHERRGETGLAMQQWVGVQQLAVGMDHSNPGLAAILERAGQFVAKQSARFEAAIASDLDTTRRDRSPEALRRFDAAMGNVLGKRQIYRNECAGLFYPFLPADEFFARHHFDWMDALEAETAVIREELNALLDSGGDGFAPYVSLPPGTPENKWTELSDSARWDACYLWKYGKRQNAIADACPNTMAALEAIKGFDAPDRGRTAFFSLLRPKTHIPPHTGVSNLRTIIHLPLIVPTGCAFRVGGETRQWIEGSAFGFDDTIEHEARNDSDELRAVLIFDVWNPYISADEREMVSDYFRSADASGLKPEPIHDI
jgi:aspartate beta-hydroxylase